MPHRQFRDNADAANLQHGPPAEGQSLGAQGGELEDGRVVSGGADELRVTMG